MMCWQHDSHFLLLLYLLLFLLVVLHDLQPLGLHQAALLDVELLFCLQGETEIIQKKKPFQPETYVKESQKCIKTNINDLHRAQPALKGYIFMYSTFYFMLTYL